jgi:hypothetical protein
MYPNITEQEKRAIAQFIKIYRDNIGFTEVLHTSKESDYGENYYQNMIWEIDHMRSVDPSHSNYRLPQYKRVIAKMDPYKVELLNNLIESMHEYRIESFEKMKEKLRYKEREYRHKKSIKPKQKRKICRCKS